MNEYLESIDYDISHEIPSMYRAVRREALPVVHGNIVLPRTTDEMLRMGGDIKDNHLGVYENVVTSIYRPDWHGRYTGGAASTLGTVNSAQGLNVRIKQHFEEKRREDNESRQYAVWELPGNSPNFLVLAVFAEMVSKGRVYFLEAVMTVIYGRYPLKSFFTLEYELANDTHPNKFARSALEDDYAAALGLKAVYGDHEHWIQRDGEVAVEVARSLRDWLNDILVRGGDETRYPLHNKREKNQTSLITSRREGGLMESLMREVSKYEGEMQDGDYGEGHGDHCREDATEGVATGSRKRKASEMTVENIEGVVTR
jgi:hypothetical protein